MFFFSLVMMLVLPSPGLTLKSLELQGLQGSEELVLLAATPLEQESQV